MTEITAQHVQPAFAGLDDNPNLTIEHWHFGAMPMPYESEAQRIPGGAPRTIHLPVEANGREVLGHLAHNYRDDYYDRIHIDPPTLDLGNIITLKTVQYHVWNAYFDPHTLISITGMDEGTDLEGPALPLAFAALAEYAWDVSVRPDGPAKLDSRLIFTFDDVPSPEPALLGNRIVAWVWPPNWGEAVTERLTWLTDILTSTTGVEQRRAMRIAPRREFAASFVASGATRAMFDLACAAWGARQWALPVWWDVQFLQSPLPKGSLALACETEMREFYPGGIAILIGEDIRDYEALEIESVSAAGVTLKRATELSWPVGTRLVPLVAARFANPPSMTRETDTVLTASVTFVSTEPGLTEYVETIPDDWRGADYMGLPVLDVIPDESEDLTSSFERMTSMIDNEVGLPKLYDSAGRPFAVKSHRFVLAGREDVQRFRNLIAWLRGRQHALWLPTHAADLVPVGDGAMNDQLYIERVGYKRFGVNTLGRRDIRILLRDGSILYRRIMAADEEDSRTELLRVDPPFQKSFMPEDVLRISYMSLMRLADDVVELEHITDAGGMTRATLVFRGIREGE